MEEETKDHNPHSAQGETQHKKNWREVRATEEDIQKFLMSTLYLRHNVITGKDEFRVPEISECAAMGIWPVLNSWQMMWNVFCRGICGSR